MKKIHLQHVFKTLSLIVLSVFLPTTLLASEPAGYDVRLEIPIGLTDRVFSMGEYLQLMYPFLVGLAIFLTVGVITYYALVMQMSFGNSSARNKFLERTWSALTALVLLLLIPAIIANVNPDALNLDPPDIAALQFEQYDGRDTEDTSSCQEQFGYADRGSDGEVLRCTGLRSISTAYTTRSPYGSSAVLQLEIDAASDWDDMARDFKNQFGIKVPINHAFRGPEYQACLLGSASADHPASSCGTGASRHTVGYALDVNVSSLTQEQYNWLACGTTRNCDYTTSGDFNVTSANSYGFKVLNYNPDVTLSYDSTGRTSYWRTEQHHFDYTRGSKPTICEICPGTSACEFCE